MASIQVFDRALCCATGVCGPEVDPALVQFAADLEWLRSLGHRVDRFNLAQQPAAFAAEVRVHQLLASAGPECLPLVFVDGVLVSRGCYPRRPQLAGWVPSADALASVSGVAPLLILDAGCDAGSGCC